MRKIYFAFVLLVSIFSVGFYLFEYLNRGVDASVAITGSSVISNRLTNVDHINGLVVDCSKQKMYVFGKDSSGRQVYVAAVDIGTGRRAISYSDYQKLKSSGKISDSDLDIERKSGGKVVNNGLWPKNNPKYAVLYRGNSWRIKHPNENVAMTNCLSDNIEGSNTTPLITVTAANNGFVVRNCVSTGCLSRPDNFNMSPYVIQYGGANRPALLIHGAIPDVSGASQPVPQTHGCVRVKTAVLGVLYPKIVAGISKKDMTLLIHE